MAAYGEETFGPVLCVYKVDNLDEAVRRANDTRYGLHFAVATRDRHLGEQVAARLDAGTVAVNDSYVVWAAMGAPLGGFKESGMGRRHGRDGSRRFTEVQTILTNRTYWQVGSGKTALSFSDGLANLLAFALRVWRHIPFVR